MRISANVMKIGGTVIVFIVTSGIAVTGLVVSCDTYLSQKSLNDKQSQQITQLERATPTGTITEMRPYRPSRAHAAVLKNVRNDPLLLQQIYKVYGTASNVPDNGYLFIDVHFYGERISDFNQGPPQFYLVPARLVGKTVVNQHWEADGVYIGEKAAPSSVESYRLTLYFCNSVDSQKIFKTISKPAISNYGLSSLPYQSCNQLDSIFVSRGT